MARKIALIGAIVLTGLIIAGLGVFGVLLAPVKKGKAEDFWYLTCRVDTGSRYKGGFVSGSYAELQGQWIISNVSHYHGSHLLKTRVDDIMRSLPEILEKMQERAINTPDDDVARGYLAWKKEAGDPPRIEDVQKLVAAIETARKERRFREKPEDIEYTAASLAIQRTDFKLRLRESKWYWASILFEFLWLAGLVWFIAWPIIKKHRFWNIIICIGLLPMGLFLPYFMGYAAYTFTSCFPRGGILYPFIIVYFNNRSMNQWDIAILEHTPQILEPLSQIGLPLTLYDIETGGVGPTMVLLAGLLLALITAGVGKAVQRIKKIRMERHQNQQIRGNSSP
jgi:hypothetical protein